MLVTGSSRGIGRAIALQLSAEGWDIAIHYSVAESEAQSLKGQIATASEVYQADLSDPSKAGSLFDKVISDGPLDAIVNNAGIYRPGSFVDQTDEEFGAQLEETFNVNLASPIALTRKATRYFSERGGGKIVNVASRVGFKGEGGAALYAASKAALINLTRSLAVELAPKNIGVFAIAPGWVNTAMARDGMQERLPAILETLPLGRMASPEDCAHAVSFLLSNGAAYLSGQTIDINGGSYFH